VRQGRDDKSAHLSAGSEAEDIARRLDLLEATVETPELGNHVFFSCTQEMETSPLMPTLRRLIEWITQMHAVIGFDLQGQDQAESILASVTSAALCVADITGDNVNVCIEVGMAKAAGRLYELISAGETRSPPFMIRGPNALFYEDDLGQLGALHRLLRRHRRHVLNAEL